MQSSREIAAHGSPVLYRMDSHFGQGTFFSPRCAICGLYTATQYLDHDASLVFSTFCTGSSKLVIGFRSIIPTRQRGSFDCCELVGSIDTCTKRFLFWLRFDTQGSQSPGWRCLCFVGVAIGDDIMRPGKVTIRRQYHPEESETDTNPRHAFNKDDNVHRIGHDGLVTDSSIQ